MGRQNLCNQPQDGQRNLQMILNTFSSSIHAPFTNAALLLDK